MARIEQAIAVLGDAESRLRSLMGEAAAAGDYDEVDRITAWARSIHAIVGTGTNWDVDLSQSRTESVGSAPQPTKRAFAPRPSPGTRGKRRARQGSPRTKRAPAKGEYPKFFRQNDVLIKVGWSKKERSEYVHRAARNVVDALASAIARDSANGKLITSEQLMPLTDLSTGEELPGYQVYVALAWFKSAGLVEQHGRSGYTVHNTPRLLDGVTKAWEKLPREA